MFQTNHQKQPPIKNTKIIKTVGTNNEGNRQEYKPHVKNNPKQLIIIKEQKHMDKNNNKDVQTTLARNQNAKDILETQTNAKMFKLVWLGAHGQTSLKICVVICVVFPMFFCLLILSQKCLKIFVFVFLFLFPMCFCCFLYVPFMCGIGWDSPDPWARGEWWATQRQVQRDSQLAAGRCASFRLRSAPLRSAVLRSAALRCTALSFGVLARTPLSPGLELSGGLASKGEI